MEVLEQEAADDGPECGTTGEHRGPGGDRDATVLVMVEDVADERQCRWHEGSAENAEQGAGEDEHLGGGGERREQRGRTKADGPDDEQLATSDPITEAAHGHQQTGEHERVDVDDPQQLRARRMQAGADCRDREAEDRVVDRDQQHGDHEHRESGPFAPAGTQLWSQCRRHGINCTVWTVQLKIGWSAATEMLRYCADTGPAARGIRAVSCMPGWQNTRHTSVS